MRHARTPDEESAALSIRDLAHELQNIVYYHDDPGMSNRSKIILTKCYRTLKAATDHYFEEAANPLVWTPAPGVPFTRQRRGMTVNERR